MDGDLLNKVIEAIKCNKKNEELELLSKLVQIPIIGAEKWELKNDPEPPASNNDLLRIYKAFFDISNYPHVTGNKRIKKFLGYLDMIPEIDTYRKEEYLFMTDIGFAKLPNNDKTGTLLNDLKESGFISKETKIEHFRVIFGIPVPLKQPFEPIKWCKNQALFRFFIDTLFTREALYGKLWYIIPKMFANKHGESLFIPKSDKKRLENSAEYEILKSILKRFNE